MAAKTAVSTTRRVSAKATKVAVRTVAKMGTTPMGRPAREPSVPAPPKVRPKVAKKVAPVRKPAEPRSSAAGRLAAVKGKSAVPEVATARKAVTRSAVATAPAPRKALKVVSAEQTPARASAPAPSPKAKLAKAPSRSPAPGARSVTRGGSKAGAKRRVRYVAPTLREVKVKELDPVARCGPDTSVELLYRVDERLDGRAAGVHLVFFDRYGWYCVHGRGCAAVADVHQDLRAQRRSVPRLATTTRALGR